MDKQRRLRCSMSRCEPEAQALPYVHTHFDNHVKPKFLMVILFCALPPLASAYSVTMSHNKVSGLHHRAQQVESCLSIIALNKNVYRQLLVPSAYKERLKHSIPRIAHCFHLQFIYQ